MKNNPKISYSQCWEDANIVLKALKINSGDVVVSIASGGCNSFSIASKNPDKLFIIDTNKAQLNIVKLKLAAIKNLDYAELLEFLGITKSAKRIDYFNKISVHFDNENKNFWINRLKSIKNGLIHCGKFEKYLKFFRKFILVLIESEKNKDLILTCSEKEIQKEIFDSEWNNFRWRFFFKIFFSKLIMKKRGRSTQMFKYEQTKNTAQIFLERFENGLKYGNVFDNEYLEYIFKGNFYKRLPNYLEKQNIDTIKKSENIYFQEVCMLDFLKNQPENSISKFNLSDIFEALSEEQSNGLFAEILRTSVNNARIIFWNNLVYRNVPENLKQNFIYDDILINDLKSVDKIFFYEKFYIYEIKK